MRLGRFVYARIHRLLFVWFALTIVLTGAVVATVVGLTRPRVDTWQQDLTRIESFVSDRFAKVWDEPAERRDLAQGIARAFQVDLALRGPAGDLLDQVGAACDRPQLEVSVVRGGKPLGRVEACLGRRRHWGGVSALLALVAACFTLWVASAVLARRLVRPLSDLIRVTREIGSGNLSSRVRIGRHYRGEIGVLADAVNDMAVRIERQLNDQRELLAAVSHEVRSPLSRLRVLVELLQNTGLPIEALGKLEQEVLEIDALIGKLLAHSRLDFGAVSLQSLSARDLAARALERALEPPAKLQDETQDVEVRADPTLLSRALGNLIENAQKHAGGLERLRLQSAQGSVTFEVCDRGPGFSKSALEHAFDPFYRDGASASLGLGLSLVQRIVQVHGGRARAENRPEGGAQVSLTLPESKSG